MAWLPRPSYLRALKITTPVLVLTASDWECDLSCSLMRNAGRVLSRAQIEQPLYGWGHEVASNAIEVHIHHWCRKRQADIIETVRGVDYFIHAGGGA